VIVPRGGKSLIARLMADARVPMIKHLDGICHTFIDCDADLDLAITVCDNAKTQRYAPCNAMETLLVHEAVASAVLPRLCKIYQDKGVELRVDLSTRKTLEAAGFQKLVDATDEDWTTEYLAPILSIKTVGSLDEAMDHIEHYGSSIPMPLSRPIRQPQTASCVRSIAPASWSTPAPALRMALSMAWAQRLGSPMTSCMHVARLV
jgi:glutamate-5-semialdehyde dehydrogenase